MLLRNILTVLAAEWLLSVTSTAVAAEFSIGVAAGADRGRVDCVAAYECERSSSNVKLTAAYLLSDTLDLQLAFFDAGKFKGGDLTPVLGTPFGGSFKVRGVGLSVGYRYDVAPQWSATARAGLSSMRTRFDYANPFSAIGSVSETKLEPLLGVSIGYAVTPSIRIGLDYDLTRFKVYRTQGPLHMLGVAAQFSF